MACSSNYNAGSSRSICSSHERTGTRAEHTALWNSLQQASSELSCSSGTRPGNGRAREAECVEHRKKTVSGYGSGCSSFCSSLLPPQPLRANLFFHYFQNCPSLPNSCFFWVCLPTLG